MRLVLILLDKLLRSLNTSSLRLENLLISGSSGSSLLLKSVSKHLYLIVHWRAFSSSVLAIGLPVSLSILACSEDLFDYLLVRLYDCLLCRSAVLISCAC